MARAVLDTGANQVTLELEYAGFVDAATNGSIGASTSSVKLTLADVYVCTGSLTFYDSSNKCVVTGTLVADKTVTNSNLNLGRNDQAKITSLSPSSIGLAFGSTTAASLTVDMTGLGYPGDMKGTLNLTAPRRIYGKPATPSVSISTSSITWSGNQTNSKADKYWQNADVDYQINDTWYSITTSAAPGDTSRSFSSSANNRYRGRVRAKNQDATGDYGYSAHYYTTPSAPSNLKATRAAGDATTYFTWTNNARYSGGLVIRRTVGSTVTDFPIAGNLTSAHIGQALDVEAKYSIYCKTPQGWNQATSAQSNQVTVAASYLTPSAPTSVALAYVSDTTATTTIAGNNTNSSSTTWWQNIEIEAQLNEGTWGGRKTVSGSSKTISVTGLSMNQRVRVRGRSTNPTGESAWVYSGYIYTTPNGPTGATVTRQKGQNKLTITATPALWASATTIRRSLDDGKTWTSVGSLTNGSFTDSLHDEKAALYELTSVTPSPSRSSAPVIVSAAAAFTSSKAKIPGINRIYANTNRIRQVYVGGTRIWVDGD